MIQIQDTLVSQDVLAEPFVCDTASCHGCCCVEGDAGAPVTTGEIAALEEVLPIIRENLSEAARSVIDRQGVAYIDAQGDLVTSIVDGRDCVFCLHEDGCCYCAVERAFVQGKTSFRKPISCHLYPVRLKDCGGYVAVNYEHWDICKAARLLGQRQGVAVYQFLKEPLVRRFGPDWYAELELVAAEMKKQHLL